jgi:hypothetical protein
MASDKLQRIFEYRVLSARREDLRITLDDEEAQQLTRLREQLRQGVPQLDARDVYTLVPVPWPVQLALAGRFVTGVVRNASGGGVAVETADPPALGETVVLQVANETQGIEYTFPATVIWRVVRGTPSVGLQFTGTPTKTAVGRFSGVYAKDEGPAETQEAAERHAG